MARGRRVCVAFGTRPEASKLAPVITALADQDGVDPVVLVSGQHREQLDSMLELFGIVPDADLKVMTERQELPGLLGRIVTGAAQKLRDLRAEYVLVHGDTLTTFAVALASFYEGIPVGHVEAGLRSFDLKQPFPEEANRRLTDVLTDLDLPPTPLAKRNLLAEGKAEATIVVTGNTVVDAVRTLIRRARLPKHLPAGRLVGITLHRRENLPVMSDLANVIAETARTHPEVTFVYPVHLNPAVREAVWSVLEPVENIMLEDPWDYLAMLALLQRSELVITDSGGIQEEGVALGVPVVVLRNVTERPEGVDVGAITLAGTEPKKVRTVLRHLLADEEARTHMTTKENPYGDGFAGKRVAQAVAWRLGLAERPEDWR
ncbi:MAG: UDP-N-acetylglucosamine 2-epimerase (non-hydrolyzing) [Trueperaceae bacterium]|nr:MAG: UDP-N-acetylglucosamine 2-epimerase (non-hydrolyzing) [Trueperaceae bacterium]